MVAKPFACVFPPELPKGLFVVGLNFATRRSDKTTSLALITRVVTKIHGCPEQSDLIYHLYCGPKFPPPPPSYPPTISEDPEHITPLSWKASVDVARVDGVISYNTFSPNCVKEVTPETLAAVPPAETPSAIYTLPSLFNHSCHSNAIWCCFGDVMIIRARDKIPRGTEITLPYTAGSSYIKREERLGPILQRPCDCALCVADRADGQEACQWRDKLIEQREVTKRDDIQKRGSMLTNSKSAEAYAETLESTYRSNHGLPRPPLFLAYSEAMQSIEFKANQRGPLDLMKRSIQYGFKALEAAGFSSIDTTLAGGKPSRRKLPLSKERLATCSVNIDSCALIMIHMSASFVALSQMIRAERWLRAAWWGE